VSEKNNIAPEKKRDPVEAYITAFILGAATIIMTIEIIGRYIFAHSFPWSEELVRYGFVWFTLLGASYAVREKGHIVVDGVLKVLPNRVAAIVERIGELIWLAFSVYITYVSWRYTAFIYTARSVSTTTKIPMAFIYAAIPVGFALIVVRIIFGWIKELRAYQKERGAKI